jgi:hypothetical protein
MSDIRIKIKETKNIPLDYLENKLEYVISLFELYKKDGWESIDSITCINEVCHESSFMTLIRYRTETDGEFNKRMKKRKRNTTLEELGEKYKYQQQILLFGGIFVLYSVIFSLTCWFLFLFLLNILFVIA